MKNEFYKELKDIFDFIPELKEEHKALYEVIELINKAIELQDESNEINKKLNELNTEKKGK